MEIYYVYQISSQYLIPFKILFNHTYTDTNWSIFHYVVKFIRHFQSVFKGNHFLKFGTICIHQSLAYVYIMWEQLFFVCMIKKIIYKNHNYHLLNPSIALNSSVKRFCLLTGGTRFNLDSSTTFSSLLGFSVLGAFPQFTRHMSRPMNLRLPVTLLMLFCDLQLIGTSSTSNFFPSNSLTACCGKGCIFSLLSLCTIFSHSKLYNIKTIHYMRVK